MAEDTQKKKRIAIIAVSSVLLVGLVVVMTVGFSMKGDSSGDETENGNKIAQISTSKKAVKMICQPTQFKETCEKEVEKEAGNMTDIKDLVQAAFKATMKYVNQAAETAALLKDVEKDEGSEIALDACKVVLDSSARELKKSVDMIEEADVNNVTKLLADLKIWLSAAISNQVGCLEGLKNTKSETQAGDKVKEFLNVSMQLSRNALTISSELHDQFHHLDVAFSKRRLLQDEDGLPVVGHSDWTSFLERNKEWNRRRLLQDEDGLPVVGHSDWTSFLERNKEWNRRRLLQAGEKLMAEGQVEEKFPVEGRDEHELPVEGHSDWTSFLERNKEWNRRRLLEVGEELMPQVQEKVGVPVEGRDEHRLPVEGHSDWTSFLEKNKEWNRRRLLQAKDEVQVEGQDETRTSSGGPFRLDFLFRKKQIMESP